MLFRSFPAEPLVKRLAAMPALEEVVWCQEEPRNNGSWFFVESYLEDCLRAAGKPLRPRYAGRAASASPAVGYSHLHQEQQKALVDGAFGKLKGFVLTK